MDTNITMSLTEIKKYDIIKKVLNKELNGTEAAKLLDLTSRHIRRLKKKVNNNGIKALAHGNRGKPGNRRIPDKERKKIAILINRKYPDFGPTLATEKLAELDKMAYSYGAIRSIMIKEKIWKTKLKKKETHREWRQRKASKGELVQYDGSYEHWFEDRGGKVCLLASIDRSEEHTSELQSR